MPLFDKYKLNKNIVLKNKIVMAPMTTYSSDTDMRVSQDELEYYSSRAKGVSMLITGTTFFQENGKGFAGQFYGGSDEYIDSLKSLADAIKIQGAKAILQIFHGGRMANPDNDDVVSASAVRPNFIRYGKVEDRPLPRALEEKEIDEIINGFYEATKRAIKAGFDGVEIHGANTYLIQQFFSPHSNRRTDMWGGSLENRFLFPKSIVNEVLLAKKEYAKDDFVVGYRFSPEEAEEPGITIDDTLYLVDNLCKTELDYLHISLADYKASSLRDKNDDRPIAKVISDKISSRKTFIGVGNIYTKQDAEDALNYGYDLVAVGKALVSDPDWVEKVQKNRIIEDKIDIETALDIKIPRKLLKKIIDTPGWFRMK